MIIRSAVNLSIANIVRHGIDDVLPTPMEVELLRKDPAVQKRLTDNSIAKINSALHSLRSRGSSAHPVRELSLHPLAHVLLPKKEPFDFRKIAILQPADLAVYQALTIVIAATFEGARRDIARRRIFSHRYSPKLKDGQIFDPAHNHQSFRAASANISQRPNMRYMVKSDVANFFDRINIHRLESTLLSIPGLDKRMITLVTQVLLHWARRDSYGIPVGSNASRVLSEIALYNVDRSLKEAGLTFIRFADDYRIFTRTATAAHSALARLIELLGQEGLFINTRKSSIEKVERVPRVHEAVRRENGSPRKPTKEFRIIAGYGGTIPTRYRRPNDDAQARYMTVNLREAIKKIKNNKFAEADEVRRVLLAIVTQAQYRHMPSACAIVDLYPQFYPLFVDILIKHADKIDQRVKCDLISWFSGKIERHDFLPEYIQVSLVRLVGSKEFFARDVVMNVIRSLRLNAGTYFGRVVFEVAHNLNDRRDALEVRNYFDRADDWERRRIIRLMRKVLPGGEFGAWKRSIAPYVAADPFVSSKK